MHLVTGATLRGRTIPRFEADFVYRHCMEQRVSLRFLHPRSWIRWAGVRLGAWWDRRGNNQ